MKKIVTKLGEYFKMIMYGTFIQVRGYDQRVVGETPKSTINPIRTRVGWVGVFHQARGFLPITLEGKLSKLSDLI